MKLEKGKIGRKPWREHCTLGRFRRPEVLTVKSPNILDVALDDSVGWFWIYSEVLFDSVHGDHVIRRWRAGKRPTAFPLNACQTRSYGSLSGLLEVKALV